MYSAKVNMKIIKNDILEAVFQIDENYAVVSGDERIYQLLGDNTLYSFNKMIHPDDLKGFENYIESDEIGEPYIARCLIKDKLFRWISFYKMSINHNGMKRLVEIKAQNIVAVCDRFDDYFRKIVKYRNIMNQIKDKQFEYNFETGFITIYCYTNNKSEIIEKDSLKDWKNRMLRLGFVEDSAVDSFDMLCSNIENGMDSFSLTFETSLMSKGERKDTLNFRGQTVKDGSKKILVVGLISELGFRMTDKQILVTSEEGTKDSATGVLNKKTVQNRIRDIIKKSKDNQHDELMYLVIMDVDDFKRVNDTYGHYFGDEVILEFAQTLKRTVGDRGIVGRIGGDEFLALVKDIDTVDDLKIIMKTVRKTLEVKMADKQPGYHFTISAGASRVGKDADNFDDLFKIADATLYIAKGKGKDRYIIFDREKHGAFLKETLKNGHTVYSGGFMKPMEKFEMAAKLIIAAEHKGKEAIGEVFYELMDKLNIHGITVYQGNDCHRVLSVGHYQNVIEDAGYICDEHYISTFNEYGIKKVNNVASFAVDFPEIFQKFTGSNICSTLQILSGKQPEIKGMFQFDTFGENRRKWNDDDINVVKMVVIALEDVFAEV